MSEENKGNPAEAFQQLLAKKNNDGVALASQLFDENFQLREKNRALKESVPGQDSVVLSAEDGKKWEAFSALGIEPTDIQAKLTAMSDLEAKNKELASMESLRGLADAGIDGSKLKLPVLKDLLAKFPDAQIEFKKEKDKSGNEATVAYIKSDESAKQALFSEFANEHFADYLPALKVNAENKAAPLGNGGDPSPKGGEGGGIFDRIRSTVKANNENQAAKVDIDARFNRASVN